MPNNKKNTVRLKVPRFKASNGFTTSPKRSRIMSKIRFKDTKPEIAFRKALYREGIRYRIHDKNLPGRPDISNKSKKLAIFIDGEFWHGYNWEEKKEKIKANRGFWIPKIERNMQRDTENNKKLKAMGYAVFRFWEHEVKKELDKCIKSVLEAIK